MSIEVRVPSLGESIREVEIVDWIKKEGARVERDEPVVTIETEKATLEIPAPEAGVLAEVRKRPGERARVGDVIAVLDGAREEAPRPGEAPRRPPAEAAPAQPRETPPAPVHAPHAFEARVSPSARRALRQRVAPSPPGAAPDEARAREADRGVPADEAPAPAPRPNGREEEVVPMSLIRRRIAERLVRAQRDAALLTTFNEIDMGAVQSLRREMRDPFQQRYGVRLGIMSFFVKACVDALKLVPPLNGEIRGDSIVYRNYFDVGIAVGSAKGLVVPVLRDAHTLSFAEVERAIADLAARADGGRLTLEELTGGTFTITNGGVYGSLLSTPIVNPPQTGILGMHAIESRPVARDGQVVVRPMMYVALTYDHRVVDGRDAVTFLRRVKETIETPARMLLEI